MLGGLTHSAQRHSTGSVPDMTALVEVTDAHRAPKVCHALPLAWRLIEHLRSTDVYTL